MIVNTGLGFQEITDGNEVIRKFIELEKQDTFGGFRYLYRGKESTDLFFHSSFEWQMPIIDCIERLGYDTAIVRKKKGVK